MEKYASTPLGNALKKHIVRESETQNLRGLLSAIDNFDGTENVQKEEISTGARIYQIVSKKAID